MGGGGTRDTGLVTVDNLFENPARYIYIYIFILLYIYIYIYFCFGQEPTPDIRNNIYFQRFGLVAFFGDTLVTIMLSQLVCTCVYYIVADWLILNTLDAKAVVNVRIT